MSPNPLLKLPVLAYAAIFSWGALAGDVEVARCQAVRDNTWPVVFENTGGDFSPTSVNTEVVITEEDPRDFLGQTLLGLNVLVRFKVSVARGGPETIPESGLVSTSQAIDAGGFLRPSTVRVGLMSAESAGLFVVKNYSPKSKRFKAELTTFSKSRTDFTGLDCANVLNR